MGVRWEDWAPKDPALSSPLPAFIAITISFIE